MHFFKFLLILLVLFLNLTWKHKEEQNNSTIKISGVISDAVDQKIYIAITDFPIPLDPDTVLDSAVVERGEFEIILSQQDEIKFYSIWLAHEPKKKFKFVAAPGDQITFLAKANGVQIGKLSGSRQDSLFRKHIYLQSQLMSLNNRYLDSASKAIDTLKKQKYLELKEQNFEKLMALSVQEITERPDAYAGLLYFKESVFPHIGRDSSMTLFNKLNHEVQNTLLGRRLARVLELSPGKQSIVGRPFPWLELLDTNQVRFKRSLPHTKTLAILWASWCGPCIKEIPDLKKLDLKSGSNLQLVSISIDSQYGSWKDALDKQKMPWLQLWSPKGTNSELMYALGINSIPHIVLIDHEDKIIGIWQHLNEIADLEHVLN